MNKRVCALFFLLCLSFGELQALAERLSALS